MKTSVHLFRVSSFLLIVFLSAYKLSSSQDFTFVNAFSHKLYLNPGYAGAGEDHELCLQMKRGNSPVNNLYYAGSYDQYVSRLKGGLGIIWSSSYVEDLYTFSNLNAFYSFHLQIKDYLQVFPFLSLGLGIDNISEDYVSGGGYQGPYQKSYFNTGLGIMVFYKDLAAGLALDHLNNPDVGWDIKSKMPPKYTLHAQYIKHFEWAVPLAFLKPGLILQNHEETNRAIVSLEFGFGVLRLGTSLIYQDMAGWKTTGAGGFAGIEYERLKITYGLTGRLAGNGLLDIPAQEFSLLYRFGKKQQELNIP